MPGPDGVAIAEGFGDVALRTLDRSERVQPDGEVGRDGRGKGAAGAVRIPGIDAFAGKQGELLAIEDQISGLAFAVPALDHDDFWPLGPNTARGLTHRILGIDRAVGQ